jgi:hypothetical protein
MYLRVGLREITPIGQSEATYGRAVSLAARTFLEFEGRAQMKKLVLGSLMAVVVSQAAGCIITSGDEDAVITANWSLKQQSSGQIISCPPSTTTAAIYAQAVDLDFRPVGSPFIDLFDCNDNSGRTAPLPPDVYQVWVQLESEGGGTKYATTVATSSLTGTSSMPATMRR